MLAKRKSWKTAESIILVIELKVYIEHDYENEYKVCICLDSHEIDITKMKDLFEFAKVMAEIESMIKGKIRADFFTECYAETNYLGEFESFDEYLQRAISKFILSRKW